VTGPDMPRVHMNETTLSSFHWSINTVLVGPYSTRNVPLRLVLERFIRLMSRLVDLTSLLHRITSGTSLGVE
jgi:hypothetical protein